jgi:hypothetical protein
MEHHRIVQRSPDGLKATVLIICFVVLAWMLRANFKKD